MQKEIGQDGLTTPPCGVPLIRSTKVPSLRYGLGALTPMLTTTALYRSSLEWFEARS